MSNSFRTNLGDAAAWRADMRAGGVQRRPAPQPAPEPDREHVDRSGPSRRMVMATADKPPQPAPPAQQPALTLAAAPAHGSPSKFFNPEFRAEVVADYLATRRANPHLTQQAYAERIGVDQSTLSSWVCKARKEQERQQAVEERRKHRAETGTRVRTEPARSFELVSRELVEASREAERANARVAQLKAELRSYLDDEGE